MKKKQSHRHLRWRYHHYGFQFCQLLKFLNIPLKVKIPINIEETDKTVPHSNHNCTFWLIFKHCLFINNIFWKIFKI